MKNLINISQQQLLRSQHQSPSHKLACEEELFCNYVKSLNK